ncbi:Transposase [Oopsacas minuta]|uniref:Transposase n=1 Tax=Oopsacas minuta TaxID=111878 RepID=A0AAV7JM64_9METZ|nr:Transposase [Oopsacas minuta]
MYCIFFYSNGQVCQNCVPKHQTITGSFYTNECLTEVGKFYQNPRPGTGTRGLRILQDNARPHKTKLVREKLVAMKIVELDHPPYLLDLAHCDFSLFPKLKKHLSGRKYESQAQIGSAIFQYMKGIPAEDYKKYFSIG